MTLSGRNILTSGEGFGVKSLPRQLGPEVLVLSKGPNEKSGHLNFFSWSGLYTFPLVVGILLVKIWFASDII